MPRIAVIVPDLLQRTGLVAILERYFAPVETEAFASVQELQESDEGGRFDYYLTDSRTYVLYTDYFLPRRAQSAVILDAPRNGNGGENIRTIAAQDTLENILEQIGRLLNAENPRREDSSDELSPREIQVLQLIVSGAINKEVADRLNISLNTVLTHRKNITAKLGIKTLSGLTLYALMHGYISTEDITL